MRLFWIWVGLACGNFAYAAYKSYGSLTATRWEDAIERTFFQFIVVLTAWLVGAVFNRRAVKATDVNCAPTTGGQDGRKSETELHHQI